MDAILVKNLRRVFKSHEGILRRKPKEVVAVEDISFEIRQGELFGLLGPNGAGKTTTVKMLTTLLIPSAGSASILGLDVVREAEQVRPRIGFIFGGERGLYGRLSGLDNLRYFATLYYVDAQIAKQRIHELLELVGLNGRENEKVEGYSRGMRQRLHIARALLHDPEVLFLDEPTMGLDPVGARELRIAVKNLQSARKTILLTTHYMFEADALCQRLHIARALLHDPEVLFLDEPTMGLDPVGARELRIAVKNLQSARKTILLTTHYMFEADALCQRIAVINKGRIVALDTPEKLKKYVTDLTVVEIEAYGVPPEAIEKIRVLELVDSISIENRDQRQVLVVHTSQGSEAIPILVENLKGLKLGRIITREPTLEDAYVRLVGGAE